MVDSAQTCGDRERGVLGMRARRTGFKSIAAAPKIGGAALVVVALVALIGSAQAAPSTKIYDATVRVVSGPVAPAPATATLRLTLTNSTRSKQTLGSANFTAGTGITLGSVTNVSRPGQWTAVPDGNVVKFRSTVALKPSEFVSADVAVTTSGGCTAAWTTAVKQSNDFSGTGNDFALGAFSNRRPLGSFAIADIGTLVDDPATTDVVEELFVPQITLSPPNDATPVDVSAYDICGAAYIGYGSTFGTGATLAAKAPPPPPQRLEGATISPIDWTNPGAGAGSATIEPVVVETGDHVVVTDEFTGISRDSNEFDVVEKICTTFDAVCHWENGNGKIKVDAAGPPGTASLGIGFNADLSFDCDGETTPPVGGTLVNINPRDYAPGSTVTITLTYDKSIAGGNASTYSLCLSKDNGESWGDALGACPSSTPVFADANCILDQRKTQGDLTVVLFLDAHDPYGGIR